MAEAALILGAFIAGIAFKEFWPRLVLIVEDHFGAVVQSDRTPDKGSCKSLPKTQAVAGSSPASSINPIHILEDESVIPSKPPIDKRRRGVAEMRHIAEQESLKPAIHQAEVTAKNAKALEG
jgi:hypothetical protein